VERVTVRDGVVRSRGASVAAGATALVVDGWRVHAPIHATESVRHDIRRMRFTPTRYTDYLA
jgi:hypothetical protein